MCDPDFLISVLEVWGRFCGFILPILASLDYYSTISYCIMLTVTDTKILESFFAGRPDDQISKWFGWRHLYNRFFVVVNFHPESMQADIEHTRTPQKTTDYERQKPILEDRPYCIYRPFLCTQYANLIMIIMMQPTTTATISKLSHTELLLGQV